MLSGGKSANGAITGAFAQLYNADGGAERVNNWSSYGAAAGATTGGVLATVGCTAASGGGCALAAPETFAAGSLAGVPIGAGIGWAAANMANGIQDTANLISGYVHANSAESSRGTELYHLINNDTDEIDKIGVTSNPKTRYSQAYLDREGVRYVTQTTFSSRGAAYLAEWLQLKDYWYANGQLPRLNKIFK